MGHHKDKHHRDAKFTTKHVLRNALLQNVDPGTGGFPPDPTMAVGPKSFITIVNTAYAIFDKETRNRFFVSSMGDLFGSAAADVQVIYDELSDRFFLTGWDLFFQDAEVIIDMPNPAAGTYPASFGGLTDSPFSVSATIEATDPANADEPLTNDLTGKIGFIETDGFQSGSINKGTNAFDAGAIGCLFWESQVGDGTNINGSPDIPSVIVPFVPGQPIKDNIDQPMTGTIQSTEELTIINKFCIAVSKNNNPQNNDDWYIFIFDASVESDITGLVLDFPKISVDNDFLYWCTQDFGEVGFESSSIFIFNKANLVDGSSVTLVDRKVFSNQLFIWPTQVTKAKKDCNSPTLFVSTDDTAIQSVIADSKALRIFVAPEFNYIDVPYPTKMHFDFSILMPQPADVPYLEAGIEITPSILYKNSLWVVQCWNPVPDRELTICRWYELDISKIHKEKIKILQYGDIDPCDGSSISYPSINVDKDGNMAVGFTIGGKKLAASIAYTGRLRDDPEGTTRFPYQIPVKSEFSYDGGEQDRGFAITNRWGDYSALVVDPSDHKTFYAFNEFASDIYDFSVFDGIAFNWSTAVVIFQINDKHTRNSTTPTHKCKHTARDLTYIPSHTPPSDNPDDGEGSGSEGGEPKNLAIKNKKLSKNVVKKRKVNIKSRFAKVNRRPSHIITYH